MPEPDRTDPFHQRLWLGLSAAGLLSASAGLYLLRPDGAGTAAVLLKTGIMVGIFWFAYPQLHFLPRWLLAVCLTVGLVVAVRPRFVAALWRVLLVGVPLYFLLWVLGSRLTGRGKRQDRAG